LLGADESIPWAIQNVGDKLGVPEQLIADCIADLPAERL